MEDRQKELENFAREVIYVYDQSWASYESFYKYMAEVIKKYKKNTELKNQDPEHQDHQSSGLALQRGSL